MKQSDFKSESELKAMKVVDIKKHVREFNDHLAIRGYSKATKDQLIGQVLTAQDRVRNSKGSAQKPTVSFKSPPKKGEESKARPVKSTSSVKSASPVKESDTKQYSFEFYYGGALSNYLNDLMDSRNRDTNRLLGYKRVEKSAEKYLNKMKKDKKSVNKQMLKEHLESLYKNFV